VITNVTDGNRIHQIINLRLDTDAVPVCSSSVERADDRDAAAKLLCERLFSVAERTACQ
jgi:hypothetical protein